MSSWVIISFLFFLPDLLWWPLFLRTDPHGGELFTNTFQGGRLLK